jgi:hypothetical protein
VRFVDRSEERVDDIVCATGYRISLPFLSSSLVSANGRELPLYRRIAPTELGGLYFAGFVDAPGGLLALVETQGQWIAAVLTGRLRVGGRECGNPTTAARTRRAASRLRREERRWQ